MPGYTVTVELGSDAAGSTWAAVRARDECDFVLRILTPSDGSALAGLQARAASLARILERLGSEHLVRQHEAIALADGRLALVLDQVTGSSLTQLLDDRGRLGPGEAVTTLAPLFGALADLHDAGVVHGGLTPTSVQFTEDGRPLIGDLGAAYILGCGATTATTARTARTATGPEGQTAGFLAPEVATGAAPIPASDVFSLAALGWFCLTGVVPGPTLTPPVMFGSSPRAGAALPDLFASCLAADPAARPTARAAAVGVFDAAPAEPVAPITMADPATEITRRIRATASAPVLPPESTTKRLRRPLMTAGAVLLVAALTGGGATWFLGRTSQIARPVAHQPQASRSTSTTPAPAPAGTTAAATSPGRVPTLRSGNATDVGTAADSPRVAAGALLQALVDSRALAYLARNPVLLDLVYAPGASKASADRGNIGTALDNGATYIGLAFVVKNATFVDGTSSTARIRASIATPAYETGQPDGSRIMHGPEIVGPSVFTLALTRDGWRILAMTAS